MLRIVTFPHPALRYVSRPITQIDDDLKTSIREMFDLMYAARGIGLAANQVALPYRFFILNLTADSEQKDQEQVFVNPVIVKRHSSTEDEEGCLSLPGLFAKVLRARKIRVQAYNLQGELITLEADELFSRAIQHEIDHLDGKLFIDYLGLLGRRSIKDKMREFELQYRQAQSGGEFPPDSEIVQNLNTMTRPLHAVSAVQDARA